MSINDGKWICASDDFLYKAQKEKYSGEYYGKWIWPRAYVRAYMRRKLYIEKEVRSAIADFFCDNCFGLYINNNRAELKSDLSEFFRSGENFISIRAFQTNNAMQFTPALCGKIHIVYEDGTEDTIYTDENWYAFFVTDFYQTEEPADWLVRDNFTQKPLICTDIHPYFLRHSLYFRKNFYIEKKVDRAVLRASAKGLYKPFVNGICITDEKFLPGAMEKVTEYQEFDITKYLLDGGNTAGFLSGNGWYNCESWGELSANKNLIIFEIEITYKDGTKGVIWSDETCETAMSPYEENDLQFGERYNAQQEIVAWCENGVSADIWCRAELAQNQEFPLIKQSYPSVKAKHHLTAESVVRIADNIYRLDFGKTVSGRIRLNICGVKNGDRIIIKYYERFFPEDVLCDGPYVPVYFPQDAQNNAGWSVRNTDVYISNGKNSVYESEFTYTGFRYVIIEGLSYVDENTVRAAIIYNDLEEVGEITTEYLPAMQIWDIAKRGYRSNIQGGPTDCPTREKNFWNGDIQTYAPSACWYMNNKEFLSRWNLYGRKMERGVYGWDDEEYILPWTLYHFYGDKDILKNKWDDILMLARKREKDEFEGLTKDAHAPYRDHLSTENVPADFFADCYFALMWLRILQIAKILGDETVACEAAEKRKKSEAAFHKKYYIAEETDYTPKCQGAIVLAMAFELTPTELMANTAKTLNEYVVKNKYRLTTGFMSTPWLLGILCDYGYSDTAWRLLDQVEYPSWRYILKTGATAFTENWEGYTTSDPYASMNHYSYGAITRWFFEHLGGIRVFDSQPGLKEVVIKPTVIPQLGDFSVRYKTDYGIIESSWKVNGKNVDVKIVVPEGCSAKLILGNNIPIICEAGKHFFTEEITKAEER